MTEFKIETLYPVAFDSPDHLKPWGTKNDNHSNEGLINEMIAMKGTNFSVLDIGCSGGAFVNDFLVKGIDAVGIEGSDYSAVNNRANWPLLHNKNLFTCDASREYKISQKDSPEYFKFDFVSAWEVIEHIHPDRLDTFFLMIRNHLKDDGMCIGSVSLVEEAPEGVVLHQSVFSEQKWRNEILNKFFNVSPYPFKNAVRNESTSILVKLTKK